MAGDRPRGRLWFVVMLAVIVYVLVSGAIALATSDKCGGVDAARHWSIVPPRWECGSG